MRFLGFLARRIVGIAAVMVGVSIITFAISHVIPSDLSPRRSATTQRISRSPRSGRITTSTGHFRSST
jgi:ABC-type dipeptide/oligopeptide/nickel transport system permease component